MQVLACQWRSLLIDSDVRSSSWEKYNVTQFQKAIKKIEEYKELGFFMAQVIALPQSTAAVERTFSKINNNKTKLRNRLGVNTVESIVCVSETFPSCFEVDQKLIDLHQSARAHCMEKCTQREQDDIEGSN